VKIVSIALASNLCVTVTPSEVFAKGNAEPLFEEPLAIHCQRDEVRKCGALVNNPSILPAD